MRHLQSSTILAGLLLSVGSQCFAQPCSLATVRGTWGWQSHGTALLTISGSPTPMPVPFASLGIMTVDSHGLTNSRGTISVGGQIQEVSFPGSIEVKPDCTATDTYTIGPFQGVDHFVILANGNEMQVMPVKHPLGPVSGRAIFRRIAWGEHHCHVNMVRGSYAGSGEATYFIPVPGSAQPLPTPFSALFKMSFQNGGTGTASATGSMGGMIVETVFPAISIEVNPDCTATMKYEGATSKEFPGQTFSGMIRFIVLNGGDELLGMELESSVGLPVEIENHKRISMRPVRP